MKPTAAPSKGGAAQEGHPMGYQYRGTIHDLTAPLNNLPAPTPKERPPFDPAYCGTTYGYKQHRKHDQEPCEECRAAVRAYDAEWRARKRNGEILSYGFNNDACGTYAGYHRHKRHNVHVCDPCWEANAKYLADWRSRKGAA